MKTILLTLVGVLVADGLKWLCAWVCDGIEIWDDESEDKEQ